jgi:hypothetical protein
MSEPSGWLPTTPSTKLSFEAGPRDRPCWRCRVHLRWPPRYHGEWRVHFQCRKRPETTNYLELP